MGRVVFLALAILGLALLRADAQAPRRVALVIGNSSYEEAGALANPVNDAMDIAAKLREVGFEVIEGHNLGKRALERRIGEFADALSGAGVGMFFYAGHGIQVAGRNYVVPVDAKLDVPVKLTLEAVAIDEILDIMEQQSATSLVFLDACRNNPFTKGGNAADRAARPLQGLAQFDSTRGSFIAFSTAPGAVALDGTGRNSPFAAALVSHIATPGQSINDLMIAVRRDVVAATRGQQRPWEQGSLIERFEFVPGGSGPSAATVTAQQPQAEVSALERSVGDAASVEDFIIEEYLRPDAASMADTVKRLYASPATILGTPLDQAALVKAKTDWFAQFSSWMLALEPQSLDVRPLGDGRTDAIFAMNYEYVPKAAGAARIAGKARVTLGLVMVAGKWRIASELTEALP